MVEHGCGQMACWLIAMPYRAEHSVTNWNHVTSLKAKAGVLFDHY
jgi:hypothetical protein